MLEAICRGLLAAVLIASVVLKLREPRRSAAALATFGFETGRGQWGALALLVAVESALAVGVAAGSESATFAAALLMLMLAATIGSALMRGRAGAPCACFGAGSTVGAGAIVRNLLLAAAFAALGTVG